MKTFFLPYQAKWIQDTSRIKIMEKSRQIGLSWATAYRALRKAITHANTHVWICSRDLQQAQPNSANHHHKGHIGIVHACRKELPDRQDGVVNRQDDAEDDNAADHLPEEHILGFIVLADVLVGDGEQGV